MKKIRPPGRVARYLDQLFEPWMRFLVGEEGEAPSVTHRWNKCLIDITTLIELRTIDMVFHTGDQGGRSHRMTPRGRFNEYLVIKPFAYPGVWHVGQLVGSRGWVSRLPTSGETRVFIQPYPTCWFALTPQGKQLRLELQRIGYIGDQTADRTIPLF